MNDYRRDDIRSHTCLFDDFFKVDEMIVAHRRYDGAMSVDERRLIFERGDAVVVLLFNAETRTVVLVEQFRAPVLIGRRRDDPATENGWVTETVAGAIDPDESAEHAVIREALEETGYQIEHPMLVGKFFSSPGGSSERIFLYFARVTDEKKLGQGGGVAGEDIRVFQIDLDDLFDRLAKGLIEDCKLAIAAYWLKDNIGRL
jgi:nudix-type nucleoside diphosphatase (YffH/AdpP family)